MSVNRIDPFSISPLPDLNKLARVVRLALKQSENLDISIPKLENALAKCINEKSVVSANLLLQAFDIQGKSLIGAIVENTLNRKSYVVIFDDQGIARLPLEELQLSKLYKRIKRIEEASVSEIPWLSIGLALSETEANWDSIIFQAIQAKRKEHPLTPRRVSLSYESLQNEGMAAAYGGLMLTMIIPCAPYLPVSIKYRVESIWESHIGFSAGFGLSSQPFHNFHLFSDPENGIEIPLKLIDLAWRYNFDEIRQFSATATLRPKQRYRPSDFGVTQQKGPQLICSIDDDNLPASVKEIARTHVHYREYRNDEALPDGKFFGQYGKPVIYQSNSVPMLSMESQFFGRGNEKEVFLSRDHTLDFLERVMKFTKLIDSLKG